MRLIQCFLSLSILLGLVLSTTTLFGQQITYKYQIEITSGNWIDLVGGPLPVCPNQDYKIRTEIENTGTANVDLKLVFDLEAASGGNFRTTGTNKICTAFTSITVPANGKKEQDIATVKFESPTSSNAISIDIKRFKDATCSTLLTASNSSTYSCSFLPTSVAVTMPSDENVCVGHGQKDFNISCHHCSHTTHDIKITSPSPSSSSYSQGQTFSSGTTTLTIPGAAFNTAGGITKVEVTTTYTDPNTGIANVGTCTDKASTTYTVVDKPTIGNVAYSSPTTTPAKICIDNQVSVTGTCTGNCPSDQTKYKWVIRESDKTDISGSGVHEHPSTSLNTNTAGLSIHPSLQNLAPGTYDVLLVVTNDNNCKSVKEIGSNSLIINDKPGVQILHNKGIDWTNNLTSKDHGASHPIEICTGQRVQLRARDCKNKDFDKDSYTHNKATDPKDPNAIPPSPSPKNYESPCSTNLYRKYTWKVKRSNGSYMYFNNVNTVNNITKAEAVTTNSGSSGSLLDVITSSNVSSFPTVEIATTKVGEILYELEVEGHNGCVNKDDVKVEIVEPQITYKYNDDPTVYLNKKTIEKCAGTKGEIKAICSRCSNNVTTNWTNPSNSSNPLDNTISGNSTTNPVKTKTLVAAGGFTKYKVTVKDNDTGCRNVSDAFVKLKVKEAPIITKVDYRGNLCNNKDLEIKITGVDLSDYNYEIYDDDPSSSGARLLYQCATIACLPTNLSDTEGRLKTDIKPIDSTSYYLVAKFKSGATCNTIKKLPPATVTAAPDVSFVLPVSRKYCKSSSGEVLLDTNGLSSTWRFTWSVESRIPRRLLSPAINLTSINNQTRIGASFPAINITYSAIKFKVVVNNGTCEQELISDAVSIEDCGGTPILEAHYLGGTVNSWKKVDNLSPFDYVCEGEELELRAVTGVNGAVYQWNSGENTPQIRINATATSPDTIFRQVTIKKGNQTLRVLDHTVVVSRGNVNFYPQGDNNTNNIDTSICKKEALFAKANCPDCRGQLEYSWGTTPVVTTTTDGRLYQTYAVTPTTPTTATVKLQLKHGENGRCVEDIERQIQINPLPTLETHYNNSLLTTQSPQYRCDGQANTLEVKCSTCTSTTFNWNTGATTPSINVPSQGGYYAVVTDQNSCRSVSGVTVVIDALDGLNAPVVAIPSEICSGRSALLQVTPCIGCSYEWFKQGGATPSSIGINRTVAVSTQGVYYAEVKNPKRCVYTTQNINVTSNTMAIPTIQATADTICPNQTATLWTSYGSGFTYQWYYQKLDGTLAAITGATDSFYTTPPGGKGTYQVRVTYSNGCEEKSPLFVVTLETFVPNITATGREICRGQTINLSTPSVPGWQYQWYRDGIAMAGKIGSIHYADSSGTYYALVTNYNGCQAQTQALTLTKTELSKPKATTSTPYICPRELGQLSVSLCSGCEYEWFDVTPNSISSKSATAFSYNNVSNTGDYYAVVYKEGCKEISDTVSIVRRSVFTPSINSVSSVVCTGRDAVLTTQGCIGCSYSWLKGGIPVLGALNDTFHVVQDTGYIGNYQIAIDYPNGCSDTSVAILITNGSYKVNFTSATGEIICNGVGKELTAEIHDIIPQPYSYTLFFNNVAVAGYTNVTSGISNVTSGISSSYSFLNNNKKGVYTVKAVSPQGCIEFSDPISLDTINLLPVLSSRATANPNSVPASAICTNTGRVVLEVVVPNSTINCCSYVWEKGGVPIRDSVKNTLVTKQGNSGTGIYMVSVTDRGCTALSNPVSIIDATAGFNNSITPGTTSICNGQSTILEYNGATCNNCSYRWLESSNPIGGANNKQYVATRAGSYTLEVTTPLGCVDTSSISIVRSVNRPSGFALKLGDSVRIIGSSPTSFGKATPIAASADPIDLNSWVFPDNLRNDSLPVGDSSHFTSTPFNAALNCNGVAICNPGLSGSDSRIFVPNDSLVGNHLITYHYYKSGCEFTAKDVLRVLPAATISIANTNPASVPYEACIGDQLKIVAENLKYKVEKLYYFDASGVYQEANIPMANFSYDTVTYGSNTFYTSTIEWTVPNSAYASYLNLKASPSSQDSILTPFLLIHNTDLSFSGLPSSGELCSNGERLTLFGNPQGGTFSVRDISGNNIPGTIVGDSLYPTVLPPRLYSDTSKLVAVVYDYRQTYTNGNSCPIPDEVKQFVKAIDVRLTNIDYNPISISQDEELLTNLVYSVEPYKARANKQTYYETSFSGSFTLPAGRPKTFLPSDAGVGRHALTYKIKKGDCINSVEDSIEVLPAPIDIAIPDTICRDFAAVNFRRHTAFPYTPNASPPPPNSIVQYTDSVYLMRVRGEGIIRNNTNLGAETFTYDPSRVNGNHDTLIIEYVFYRDEDTSTVDFDTLEYIVASIVKPIYIEDTFTVKINDGVVQSFYCQDSALKLLTATPVDTSGRGLFMLFGGTGQYQSGDTLFNSVINPYQVNRSENATTNYNLVYTLNGVACRNSDTMAITIAKGLHPSFTTANGSDEFCDTDPVVNIIHNVTTPDTAIWKIGGIPQASYSFKPDPLNPGIHVVDLQQIYTYVQGTDTFTCSAFATDTFTIHALPNPMVTPSLEKQYCANDTIVDFVVSPSPDCPMFGAAGQYVLNENFNSGVPASWIVNTIAGKSWAPDAIHPQGGSGLATFVDTSNVVENSWLISPGMNLVAGHTYRLSYMVLAGPADPNCGSGCVASLYIGLGNSSAITSITTQLDYKPLIDNDLAYRRYTVDYYHNPSAGATTGQYHLGFRNFSPAFGRALRLDNVEMRDLTVDSCMQAGIGYVEGPGVYKVRDSFYRFDPLSVPAGNITVKYVYTNTMGCQDSAVFAIKVDTAPVVSFTNLDSSYCENEPTVMLTGSPLGGTFTSTKTTNLYDDTSFATLSPAHYPVSFRINTTGLDVVSYTFKDNNDCSETAVDSVYIVPLLDRNPIAGLDARGYGYCIVDSANVLNVTNIPPLGSGSLITNGTFYGPGVRNGAAGAGNATFHSDSAVIDMGHTGDATISYVYTTTTNCLDTTYQTVRVHAAPDLSFVNLPDSLCLNTDSFQVKVQNRVVTGATGQTVRLDIIPDRAGQFTETDRFGNPVDDFIQLFDTLYPYKARGHSQINISYLYITDSLLGACEAVLKDSVRIDSVPVVYFQGLRDYYCENDPVSIFWAFPSFNVGSGFLQIDTNRIDSSFYWINPATMVAQPRASYPTYYTFTDSRGCKGEAYDTFEVRPYPRITFSPTAQDTFCRQVGQRYDLRQLISTPLGGFFTDNLALTSIRDSFYLDLGSQPGPRVVTYNYLDSATMCQNSDSIRIYLFSAPELDFIAYGGCSQMDITFDGSANNLIAGIDSITRIWWDFEGNGNLTYTQLDTSPITIPDTTYRYSAAGTYNVTLYVTNQGACVQSVTKPLIVSPYYNLATGDYFENFNTGPGDWVDDQPISVTPSNVWTHEASLNGRQINSTNGAWVTRADSLYAPGESAWVYSPCFDFSSSIRPMIALDVWRDMLKDIDGAILEYYNNNTNVWERVGDVGEGISWYQSKTLLARPGNQVGVSFPRGWTGRSNGFESARLRLDQFKGKRDIRFRVAFATSPQTVIDSLSGAGFEGAAFDNVWIGERTRNVLVEHFSNQNYQTVSGLTSDDIDKTVYNKVFNPNYGNDVVLLQYQVIDNSTTPDPIYQSNSADLGGRSFYYSAQPGEIRIDGRLIGTGRSENLDEWEMDYDMLKFPDFKIRIDQPITLVGNTLTSSATIEAIANKPYSNYVMHMAIIQDSLTYNLRNFNMLSIVRKMQPSNVGVPTYTDWTIGQTRTIAHSWDYTNQLNVASFNPNKLEVVVFIQNDSTREVYQVSTTQDMNRYNGTQTIPTDPRTEIFDLNVYPNPSSNLFNVAFDKALKQSYNWRLVDITGRTLQTGVAEAGIEKFTIDAARLVDGAYFFVINSEDNQVYAQRKLIVIKR